MVAATALLLAPAVGRMVFLGRPVPEPIFLLVWPAPIYIAMAYDYVVKRLVHPVYLLTLFTMLVWRLCLPLRDTEVWLDISTWLAGFYGR